MISRFIRAFTAALFVMVSCVSCIFENYGDPYYRTLWMSDDPEFGVISVDFLCENMMAVKAENAEFDDYGFYSTDGKSAFFDDLQLSVEDVTAVFVQALRKGDSLELLWQSTDGTESTVLDFKRLSSYDQLPKALR